MFMSFQQSALLKAIIDLAGFPQSIDLDSINNKLNEHPQIPNPNIPLVPLTLNIERIAFEVGSATYGKMADGQFPVFFQACQDNDHATANVMVNLWESQGKFTAEELAKIRSLTATQELDPYAPATIPGPSLWESQFLPSNPNFSVVIDGVVVTQCHKKLVAEAIGVNIQ